MAAHRHLTARRPASWCPCPSSKGDRRMRSGRTRAWPTVLNEARWFLRFQLGQDRHPRSLQPNSVASSAAVGALRSPADISPAFGPVTFSADAGSARAAAWKPTFECVPSQNGLFVDAPQRQSTVLVWVGKTFPFASRNSIEPLTIYGPFGLTSIVTSAMRCSFFICQVMHEPSPVIPACLARRRLGEVLLLQAKLCAICSRQSACVRRVPWE